ncbi:tryptophan synthase subunit alpha [Cryomorpha ignava]|nr:tryptophan synthase subunit alpha [Cryomorpha ignava]
MNRIHNLFGRKKENILSIYFTAGYPSLDDTTQIIRHLDAAGVDLIELGMPFSDPLADGPVIQESGQKAIQNGMSVKVLFEQLKDLRSSTEIPVILMGYLNPILQFGEEQFIEKCVGTGIDGVIIPDMPLPYYKEHWEQLCRKKGLSNILLITPETTDSRIAEIDVNSDGFIYMVSSNSITGSNKAMDLQKGYFERIEKMELRNPRLIGFGIHDQQSFDNACSYSNGAIIGSAFINHLSKEGTSADSIQKFYKKIKP